MEWEPKERILVLGGSRGLGAAIVTEVKKQDAVVLPISRTTEIKADFSKPERWNDTVLLIRQLEPTRLFYCAAGGPYGFYDKFDFKDHQWAWRVTYEFPAFLLHSFLREPLLDFKQMNFIGSSIAENEPDSFAASYCAAKHALRGLIKTAQLESHPTSFDIRLLSPGYMDTDLLPPKSAPREAGNVQNPHEIAQRMIHSISDPALRMSHQSFD